MDGSPSEAQRINFLLSGSRSVKGDAAYPPGSIRVSPDHWASPGGRSATFSAPEENLLRAGDWKVAGPQEAIRRLAKELANEDFAARGIAEVNDELRLRGTDVQREDWYSYYIDVRHRTSDIALEGIVSALGSSAPQELLEIVLPHRLLETFRRRHPEYAGRIVVASGKGRLESLPGTAFRWGYSVVRAVLGLARLVRLRLGRPTGDDRDRILVARSDVYRRLEDGWGDPNTASLVASARSAGRDVAEVCYPHVGGAGWRNLWQFVIDRGCLSFEGAYVAARMMRPLATGSRLEVARRASQLVLRAVRPGQAFVSGEYSRFRKALVEEAKASGATVAGVQHGVVHSQHPGYTFPSGILTELKPDYFLAHGQAYVEVLRRIDYASDTRVLCAGHPTMPALPAGPSKRDGDSGERVLLITSQPTSRHDIRQALMAHVPPDVEEYLRTQVRCVVKLHPSFERPDGFYDIHAGRYPFRDFRVEHVGVDLFDLFRSCDLHVSFTSTCLQEALAMGIPCIELLRPPQDFSFSREFGSYLPEGLLNSASTDGLLLSLVESLRAKGRQRLSVEDVARCRDLFAAPLRLEEAIAVVTDNG